MQTQFFVLSLAVLAHGLILKTSDENGSSSDDFGVCQIPKSLPVTSLALANDDALDVSAGKSSSSPDQKDLAQKRATLQAATLQYKQKKVEYQRATNNLMSAMEALLEVPSAGAADLGKVAEGKTGKDTLLVFYAPWCMHCQRFVLHDGQGNPTNAPLEVLRRDFAKSASTSNVAIMRADVTKLGQAGIPQKFPVQAIPTVFFVNAKGITEQFKGNPHDVAKLKGFVAGLSTKKA
jgi:thiol-disulfide isomerase/thioredoxin